jgi:short-subunit dehydrogenase
MRAPNLRKLQASLLYRPTGIFSPRAMIGRGPSLRDAAAGKTILVTGASQGIGEAIARLLGANGADIILVARNRERLDEIVGEIETEGGTATAYDCDLADPEQSDRLAAMVKERHDDLDVLVNNAGRSIRRSVDLSYDRPHDFERTMELNYFGAVRLILAFLPGMRERGRGQVVNVSTSGVHVRVPRFSAYTASKTALDAFSDCVAAESRHDGVRFTAVHMPLVRTPMIEPTAAYRNFPSISAEQAARRVGAAITHRPRRVGTVLSDAMGIINVISPASSELMRSIGYRLVPDSRAARGESRNKTSSTDKEQASNER